MADDDESQCTAGDVVELLVSAGVVSKCPEKPVEKTPASRHAVEKDGSDAKAKVAPPGAQASKYALEEEVDAKAKVKASEKTTHAVGYVMDPLEEDASDAKAKAAPRDENYEESPPPPLSLRLQQGIRPQSVPGAFAAGSTSTTIGANVRDSTEFVIPANVAANTDGLAVADLVEEQLPHASQFDPESGTARLQEQEQKQRSIKTILFLIGILVLAGIGLAIAFGVGLESDTKKEDDDLDGTSSEVTSLDGPTTMWLHDIFMDLLPDFARNTLEESLENLDFEAPQYKALAWLFADPNVDDYPNFRLIQRYALATLYFSARGPQWTNSTNWMSYHHHECLWYSYEPLIEQVYSTLMYRETVKYQSLQNITCRYGDQKHIDHLLLMDNNLRGDIPEELFLLSSLQVLDFDINDLGGTLSTRIAMLPSLTVLNINTNQLTGAIPSEIFTLSNLTQCFLEYNGFTGTVNTEVGLLTNMELLAWAINELTGTIPTQIGLLSNSLQYFNVAVNNMVGTLPTELGRLTELIILGLHDNLEVTGTLPTEMGQMTSVVNFHMRDMGLSGTIPTQVGLWNNSLEVLYFQTNKFTGTLPTQLGLMSNAIKLSVNSNQLTGPLPSQLGHLSFLGNPEYHSYSQIQRRWGPDWANLLEAHDNFFTGTIPTEYGHIGALTLALDGNDLSGSIPLELHLHTDLRRLHLSGNSRMTGTIPPELFIDGMWDSLFTLKVANIPGMTGALPSELGACTLLSDLVLANCNWTGTIPEELGDLAAVNGANLTLVDLTGNPMLVGVIPEGLCSLGNDGLLFDCSTTLCGCACSCNASSGINATILEGRR